MTELWVEIEECPKYEVSNMGNVRNKKTGHIIAFETNYAGYHRVIIDKNGKPVHRRVARLVATAFIPNPDNLPEVDHINHIRNDDRVDNLQWCSRNYNNANRSSWNHTEETKRAKAKVQTGKRRYNNGIVNTYAYECPEGFVPGWIK